MTELAFIKTGESVSVYLDGEVYSVDNSHANYKPLLDALRSKDVEAVKSNLNTGKAIEKFVGKGRAYYAHGTVYYDDAPVQGVVVDRIISMMAEGFDVQPMLNFLEKVYQNPSNSAIEETYLFMEHNDLVLHPDGDLLAYKMVTENYRDKHTGKIDNSIGNEISMDRRKVDDRRNITCSHGLHVASLDYASGFGAGKLIVVKVNPRDIVSIPEDYHNQKARVCRYVSFADIKEHKRFSDTTVYTGDTAYSHDDDDDDVTIDDVTVKYHNKRDALGRFTN